MPTPAWSGWWASLGRTRRDPWSYARLGGERSQLQLVRPAGLVLRVQIVERVRDLHGVHHDFGMLLGPRQGARPWRVDETVDHDVGHVDAVLGILLGEHLGQRPHHDPRIVERLAGHALSAAEGGRVVRNEERAAPAP